MKRLSRQCTLDRSKTNRNNLSSIKIRLNEIPLFHGWLNGNQSNSGSVSGSAKESKEIREDV